ncbi:hypothetical protein ACJIZ3_009378 [Penstemon smallii]|uniref:Pectinesterase inhibitor domain-containing protein n=1 Tax=Penstemon smallii TaxID=265156 RepID=A0ABD3TCV1_9LAMI
MKNNIQMSIAIWALVTALVIDQQVNAANDLVRQMCGRTDNNNLCVSIIEADPRENLKNSPNGLCGILRDKAVSIAVATTPKISNLLKTTTNTYARQCLQICLNSYEKSIMELKSVDFREINHRNYGSLGIVVSYGSLGPEDCEECFAERPGTPPSPLKPENKNMLNVVNLVLEILNLTICNKITGYFKKSRIAIQSRILRKLKFQFEFSENLNFQFGPRFYEIRNCTFVPSILKNYNFASNRFMRFYLEINNRINS